MAEDSTGDYANVKAWVVGRLAEALPMDLWEWSHDGKRLCKLVNILAPGTVDMSMVALAPLLSPTTRHIS